MCLPPTPGSYLLELASRRSCRLEIGRLGYLQLLPGHYYYAGSAFGPGGLVARVGRHLRGRKPKHWHVDYLRLMCRVTQVYYATSCGNREHAWSAAVSALPGVETPLHGFGASDCGCAAHLYYSEQPLGSLLLQAALAVGDASEVMVMKTGL